MLSWNLIANKFNIAVLCLVVQNWNSCTNCWRFSSLGNLSKKDIVMLLHSSPLLLVKPETELGGAPPLICEGVSVVCILPWPPAFVLGVRGVGLVSGCDYIRLVWSQNSHTNWLELLFGWAIFTVDVCETLVKGLAASLGTKLHFGTQSGTLHVTPVSLRKVRWDVALCSCFLCFTPFPPSV